MEMDRSARRNGLDRVGGVDSSVRAVRKARQRGASGDRAVRVVRAGLEGAEDRGDREVPEGKAAQAVRPPLEARRLSSNPKGTRVKRTDQSGAGLTRPSQPISLKPKALPCGSMVAAIAPTRMMGDFGNATFAPSEAAFTLVAWIFTTST